MTDEKTKPAPFASAVVDFLDRSKGTVERSLCYPITRIELKHNLCHEFPEVMTVAEAMKDKARLEAAMPTFRTYVVRDGRWELEGMIELASLQITAKGEMVTILNDDMPAQVCVGLIAGLARACSAHHKPPVKELLMDALAHCEKVRSGGISTGQFADDMREPLDKLRQQSVKVTPKFKNEH